MGAKRMDFWPRQLIRRLLKPSVDQESVTCSSDESLSDRDDDVYTAPDVPAMLVRRISETLFSDHINTEEIKVVAATWNVAGRRPPSDLEVDSWLGATTEEELADVYVIGFQEIVPLNAGNVLGGEQDGAASVKWENIIRRSINHSKPSSLPVASKKNRRSISCDRADLQNLIPPPPAPPPPPAAPPLLNSSGRRRWRSAKKRNCELDDDSCSISCSLQGVAAPPASRFVRIASKKMVGIFITVWARSGIRPAIRNVKVSCVGRGLMGYLGNKGSISVSLSVHETSFCFVCSHLTSGEREGDEQRRNGDVTEILRRTYFSRPKAKFIWPDMPDTIMGHDRIIWLGDLNYRLTLPDAQTRLLIAKRDWQTLLGRDQLWMEKKARRVFDGWQEGRIDFPPTYKYVIDSNRYYGLLHDAGEKRRTPAWCDRILWYGEGLKQLQYRRSESKLSDHRPVSSAFLAQVDVFEDSKLRRLWTPEKTEGMLPFDAAPQNHDSEVVSPIAVF